MDHIVQDKSGTLVPAIFYEFGVPLGDELPTFYDPAKSILSKRSPSDDDLLRKSRKKKDSYLWTTFERGEGEKRLDCPQDPTHLTAQYWTKCTLEVYGGSLISPFIPESQEDLSIVSAPLAKQLQVSGLTGLTMGKVELNLFPQSAVGPSNPVKQDLFVLAFRGRNCERSLVVRGAPNACPFCGRAPLCCPGCTARYTICPKCNEATWTPRDRHKGKNDRRLVICPPKDRTPEILDGSRWDGSDFIYAKGASCSGFITRRALDWLQSVHAAPFHATTVRTQGPPTILLTE